MKKYVKPELFYEQFELSKHIADCALEYVNSGDMNTCAANPDPDFNLGLDPNTSVFTNKGVCEMQYYCYTNGVEGVHTFKS